MTKCKKSLPLMHSETVHGICTQNGVLISLTLLDSIFAPSTIFLPNNFSLQQHCSALSLLIKNHHFDVIVDGKVFPLLFLSLCELFLQLLIGINWFHWETLSSHTTNSSVGHQHPSTLQCLFLVNNTATNWALLFQAASHTECDVNL